MRLRVKNKTAVWNTVFSLLFFATVTVAQELPKAILVDEFSVISCEDLLARTDVLFAQLIQHPDHTGLVLISRKAQNSRGFREFITATFYLRPFDRERIKILEVSSLAESSGQFWRLPPGAVSPYYEKTPEPVQDMSKPYVFGYESEERVCPSFVPELYANLLKEHPRSFGKIVVRGNSWRSRQSLGDYYLDKLRSDFGLSTNQFRIYYIHRPNKPLTEAEFWFVPANDK